MFFFGLVFLWFGWWFWRYVETFVTQRAEGGIVYVPELPFLFPLFLL
jgi:hypothetical protein